MKTNLEAIEAAKKVLFKDTAKNRAAAWSAESAAWSAEPAAIKKIQLFMNKQYKTLEEYK